MFTNRSSNCECQVSVFSSSLDSLVLNSGIIELYNFNVNLASIMAVSDAVSNFDGHSTNLLSFVFFVAHSLSGWPLSFPFWSSP